MVSPKCPSLGFVMGAGAIEATGIQPLIQAVNYGGRGYMAWQTGQEVGQGINDVSNGNYLEAAGHGLQALATGIGTFEGIVPSRAPSNTGGLSNTGSRGANRLQPDPTAQGPHTTFRSDPQTGQVTHYETWQPQSNLRNPNPWESVGRYDGTGGSHYNKATGQDILTPHVHSPTVPGGVRPALPHEVPQ